MNLIFLSMISIAIEIFQVFYICKLVSDKQQITIRFVLTALFAYLLNFAVIYFESTIYITYIKSFLVFIMIAVIVYKINLFKAFILDFIYLVFVYISDIITTVILSFLLGETYDNIPSTDMEMAAGMFLTSFILFILIIPVAYLFRKKTSNILPKHWIFIALCYASSFVILAIIDVLAIKAKLSNPFIVVFPSLAMIVLNVALMNLFKTYSDGIQLSLMKELEKIYSENYKILESSEREIRILRHDMKNHICVIQSMLNENNTAEVKTYLQKINDTIDEKGFSIYTKNTALDAVMNTKQRYAINKGIKCTIKTNINEPLAVSPFDIGIIFGNAFDNAIEGSLLSEKKFISISIEKTGDVLTLIIYNSSPPRKLNEQTSKQDQKNHGLGIKSIKNSLEKYDGNLFMDYKDGVFVTKILLKIGRSLQKSCRS